MAPGYQRFVLENWPFSLGGSYTDRRDGWWLGHIRQRHPLPSNSPSSDPGKRCECLDNWFQRDSGLSLPRGGDTRISFPDYLTTDPILSPKHTCWRNVLKDQIGKVFMVNRSLRMCLVCEKTFSRQESAAHAQVPCYPAISQRPAIRKQKCKSVSRSEPLLLNRCNLR